MKIIHPQVQLMIADDNEKLIELAGRTCYKSEDKIREGSASDFVKRLIRRGHEAMLEHSNIIMKFENAARFSRYDEEIRNYERKTGLSAKLRHTWLPTSEGEYRGIISGNARAWRDFGRYRYCVGVPLTGALAYNCEGVTDIHDWIIDESELTVTERRYHSSLTVRIICDRGVSHELVRHRVFSFAQESTRYCDYKNEMLFVAPSWFNEVNEQTREQFTRSMCLAEEYYKILREQKLPPQAARAVLPNALKTEVVMTGTPLMWKGFFKLRCDASAHPDMQRIANMIRLLIGDIDDE